jgi:TonB family protein
MAKPSPPSQPPTILDTTGDTVGVLTPSDVDLNLLKEWQDPDYSRHIRMAFGVSLVVHFGLFIASLQIPTFVHPDSLTPKITVNKTPLYFPKELTQKEKNKNKITERFDLQDLIARRGVQQQNPSMAHRRFNPKTAPPMPKVAPPKPQPQITAEAPKVLAQNTVPPPGTPGGVIAPAPPPPKPAESPFESIGARPLPNPQTAIAPPKANVEDVIRGLTHDSGQLSVSDDSLGRPSIPGSKQMPGQLGSQVELKSDPQGIDLKPYLAQILAIVRQNWFTVLPESVRLGTRRGRVVIQFALNRDGSLAKVVISDYSGSDSLDRAAVAGLSMSNPLPPLPKDYKGAQMKLAFSFNYNQGGATLR